MARIRRALSQAGEAGSEQTKQCEEGMKGGRSRAEVRKGSTETGSTETKYGDRLGFIDSHGTSSKYGDRLDFIDSHGTSSMLMRQQKTPALDTHRPAHCGTVEAIRSLARWPKAHNPRRFLAERESPEPRRAATGITTRVCRLQYRNR